MFSSLTKRIIFPVFSYLHTRPYFLKGCIDLKMSFMVFIISLDNICKQLKNWIENMSWLSEKHKGNHCVTYF